MTGGAGYVGSHALRALRRAGHTTVVLDDLRAGHEFLAQGETLARVDVGDALGVEGVFAEHGPFHGVLHFAAYLVVPESISKPMLYYRNNVGGSAVSKSTVRSCGRISASKRISSSPPPPSTTPPNPA